MISPRNSTSSNIADGGTFVGGVDPVEEYAGVSLSIYSDVNLDIFVEQSLNGKSWEKTETGSYLAASEMSTTYNLQYRYYRLRIENNSGSDSTELRACSKFHKGLPLEEPVEVTGSITLSPYDQELALASGDIAGARRVVVSARGQIITGSDRVPSDDVLTYAPLTVAESWQVVSTSNSDSASGGVYAAGPGAHQVTVVGINDAGVEVSAPINLDGTNPVVLPGLWLCVNHFYVSAVDPTVTSNVGQINLQIASTTTLRGAIAAGASEGFQMRYRSPVNSSLYLREMGWGTRDHSVVVTGTLRTYSPLTGVYKRLSVWELDDAAAPQSIPLGSRRLDPGSEIVLFAQLSSGTHEISAHIIADEKIL